MEGRARTGVKPLLVGLLAVFFAAAVLYASSPATDGYDGDAHAAHSHGADADAAVAHAQEAHARFLAWVDAPVRDPETGASLAAARRAALAAALAHSPRSVSQLALYPATIAALPDAVAAHTETWVTGTATIEMLCPFPKMLNDTDELNAATDAVLGPGVRARAGGNAHAALRKASAVSALAAGGSLAAIPASARRAAEEAESARLAALGPNSHGHSHEYNYVVHFRSGLVGNGAAESRVYPAAVHGKRNKRAAREPVPVTGIVVDGTVVLFAETEVSLSVADAVALAAAADAAGTPLTLAGARSLAGLAARAADAHSVGLVGHTLTVHESADAARASAAATEEANEHAFATKFTSFTTSGNIRTVIFLVQFSDEGAPATTEANYALTMTRLNTYWNINSYGASSYTPIEYEIITLASSKGSYATGGSCPIDFGKSSLLDNDVWAASSKLEGDYGRYVILFTEYTECPWAGLGSIAATGSWINGVFDAAAHSHVAIHELGHNYGLRHANLWASGAPPDGAGQTLPYGDDFDIMGAVTIDTDRSSFHVNTHKKHGLSWIPDADRITVTSTGQYRVFFHDSISATGPRALRIQRGSGSTTWYWIEYRTNLVFAAATPYFVNGANIHFAYELSSFETETDLIDMTPAYNTENLYDGTLNNSPLQLGSTFSDSTMNLHITPIGTSSLNGQAFLDVFVSFQAPNSPPVINSVTASCTQPEIEEAILIVADVTDPDGDLLAYSWNFGDGSLSTTNSIAVSHGWSGAGATTITLTVSDMRGSVVTATVSPQVVVAAAGAGVCPPCPNSCSGKGICSGGVCACSPGYTDADCSQQITISSIVPNFGPLAGGNVITIVGSGFTSDDTTYVCNFEGLGLRAATKIDATTLTCPTPSALVKSTIVVEVSPNNGLHYTGSNVGYTFGGGFCLNNCTYQGDCDIGPGICTCFAGFTGEDCSVAIGATNLLPLAQGPRSGGSTVSVDVTPAVGPSPPGPWDTPTATPVCRFGLTRPVPATRSGSTISCTAPPYGAAGVTVAFDVSPNGRDFTNSSLTFTYAPVTALVAGVTSPSVATLAAQYAYFRYPIGDPTGLTVTITLAAASGSPTLLARSNAVPIVGDPLAASIPGPGTLTLTDADLATGTIFISVVSAGSAADFTVTLSIAGTHNLILDSSSRVPASAAAGTPVLFTVSHLGEGNAVVIDTDLLAGSTAPTLYLGDPATASPSDSANIGSGTTVVVQECMPAGTYTVAVSVADATSFAIAARTVVPPTPGTLPGAAAGEIVSAIREESSVNISLALATSTSSYDFDLVYDIYFRKNSEATAFTTACDIRSGGTVFRQGLTFGSFGTPIVQVTPLDASTNYQVGVVVRTPDGVEKAYAPALQKTKPPPIPKALIYGLVAGSVGVALLAGCVVGFFRLRKRSRKKRKHRTKGIVRRRRKSRRGASHSAQPGAVAVAAGAGLPRRGRRKGGPRHAEARQTRVDPRSAPAPARAHTARSSKASRSAARSRGHPRPAPAAVGRPAVARGAFVAQHANELSFPKGAHILVIAPMEGGWVKAQFNGRVGLAPASYLKAQ